MAELDARRSEVLGNAAKIIQKQMRTYIARKEYILIRRAAIQLQACRRGLSACKQFEQLRREVAAVKIQKDFRCFVASKSYLTLRSSAIRVQMGLRAMIARGFTTVATYHILTTRVFRKLHYILSVVGGEELPEESFGSLKC